MQTRRYSIDTYLAPGDRYHFARKALDPRPPGHTHDHDAFELFLIEQGSTQHFINGETEEISAGRLVFIRPADTHAFQARGASACRIINVMIPREIIDHLGRRYADEFRGRFFWAAGLRPDAYRLEGPQFERAVNSSLGIATGPRSLTRIEAFLLNLMTRVVDHRLAVTAHAPPWLMNACREARAPAVFRAGPTGFVAVAGRAHAHVSRQCRRHLGLSPTDLINRIRMEHAAMLLGGSDMTIADVAADCGLENLSHFYGLFRKHYGATPRAYRLRHYRDPLQSAHEGH